MRKEELEEIVLAVKDLQTEIGIFAKGWLEHFLNEPALNKGNPPPIHSVKYRLKSENSIRGKIKRKIDKYGEINKENVFSLFTDLGGVRVLHLYLDQFELIHRSIMDRVERQRFFFCEQPKAYTWDPETHNFFKSCGLMVEMKPSFYTSVHYVLRPFEASPLSCEIQVRTLFEEIWGEIDHSMNYPDPTESEACKDQILVMAKLVGAGRRLADSIFKEHARSNSK